MTRTYKRYDQSQQYLLPLNKGDLLPEDHLVFMVSDIVDMLDLSSIIAYYERTKVGNPPYDPRMMVKLLIYGNCTGRRSSRMIRNAVHEDVGFRILAAENFPDHRTICEFRRIHRVAFEELFLSVVRICKEAGMAKMGIVAIDGTKIKANASLAENRKLEKLKEEEELLQKEIRKMVDEMEMNDIEEDAKYGKDKTGDEVPKHLRSKKDRLERIKRAKESLEEKKNEKQNDYEQLIEERRKKEKEQGKKLRGRKPKPPQQEKDDEPKRNMTDPDSRIMKTKQGYEQAFNAQIVVDADTQVILTADVVQDENDVNQLKPMYAQLKNNIGAIPDALDGDAGYYNGPMLEEIAKETNLYIATTKSWKLRKEMKERGAPRGRIPNDATPKERMERKLTTKRGHAIYARRSSSVEPVFGQIKTVQGLRNFLTRGILNVKGEFMLASLAHNVLKLWRADFSNKIAMG